MKWIKVVTRLVDDPEIAQIATACKIDAAWAEGCCVNVFLSMAEKAKHGNLSAIPDTTLEQWARWNGKRGAFAKAFRAHLCENGVVREWEEINGAAIRESDRDQKRKADWRAEQAASRKKSGGRSGRKKADGPEETPQNGGGNVNAVERESLTDSRLSQPPQEENQERAAPCPVGAGLPQEGEF